MSSDIHYTKDGHLLRFCAPICRPKVRFFINLTRDKSLVTCRDCLEAMNVGEYKSLNDGMEG